MQHSWELACQAWAAAAGGKEGGGPVREGQAHLPPSLPVLHVSSSLPLQGQEGPPSDLPG